MTENVSLDSENTDENLQIEDVAKKLHPIRRFGCGVLLIIWFTLLLTPCALFYLAANGEIRIWHSDIPEPNTHPRMLLELVSEVDYRGLQLTRSFPVNSSDDMLCIQTDVSFLLWQSIEEDLNTSYCDCYQQNNSDTTWILNKTITGVCP